MSLETFGEVAPAVNIEQEKTEIRRIFVEKRDDLNSQPQGGEAIMEQLADLLLPILQQQHDRQRYNMVMQEIENELADAVNREDLLDIRLNALLQAFLRKMIVTGK